MRTYMPYIKTRHGTLHDLRPWLTMQGALGKFEEWAKEYHITSAWIDERDDDEPPYFRRHKVKLIGVLKKGETNMTDYTREISKEVYDRAMAHGGCVTEADKHELFSEEALYGYGVYGCRVKEICGKYLMTFSMGDSCD